MTATQREKHENLEIGSKEPNLRRMLEEIENAAPRMQRYLSRNEHAFKYCQSRWDGQTMDGRRHASNGEEAYPYEGASDTRVRTVKQIVRDYVTLQKAAFNQAKVQAATVRPLAPGNGRRSNQATWLLKWMLFTHMRAELQRELPIAFAWKSIYGACLLATEWTQSRRLEYHDLTVGGLADVIAARDGLPPAAADQLFLQLQASFSDPAQEEALTNLIRGLMLDAKGAPVLTQSQTARIVRELRQERTSSVPVPYVFKSKPKWTALRIGVDIVFLDRTGDLQEEPWIARYERVSETTLRDRIETEDYTKAFVEEVLEHGGAERSDNWIRQTAFERSLYGNDGHASPNWMGDVEEKGYDLVHFYYQTVHYGTPCLYRTIFAPEVLKRERGPEKPLYARHGLHEYEHGQYPFHPMRFEKEDHPITSSQGVPEYAYTWEQEEKTQADGLADRAQLINNPPMIVPYNRVHALKGQRMPGAILGAHRPQEIVYPPLPPSDGSPVQVMEHVHRRCQEFFGIFGNDVDPEKKMLRRQEVADDTLGELCLAMMQTWQLMQQFMTDEEVATIVGTLERPFRATREAIQEAHEITAVFDARMLDEDYASKKLALIQQAMTFNQGGNANTNGLLRIALELVDPDAADQIVETDQVATERETNEEELASLKMLNGMEPAKPTLGNFQLRLQALATSMQQPSVYQQLMTNPEKMQLFQNRIEYFQNQIQQHTENPAIGRALSTQTFNKQAAPRMQLAGA